MTVRKPKPNIHAKCCAVSVDAGRTLVCWKSPEHIKSANPERRKHYDPDAERHWTS